MNGFEAQTSGIGSNHSANWATTTAQFELAFVDCGKQPAYWRAPRITPSENPSNDFFASISVNEIGQFFNVFWIKFCYKSSPKIAEKVTAAILIKNWWFTK